MLGRSSLFSAAFSKFGSAAALAPMALVLRNSLRSIILFTDAVTEKVGFDILIKPPRRAMRRVTFDKAQVEKDNAPYPLNGFARQDCAVLLEQSLDLRKRNRAGGRLHLHRQGRSGTR